MEEHGVAHWIKESDMIEGVEVIDARFNDVRTASGLLRTRLVGRQYNVEASYEYFTGTPPLAMMKYLASRAASRGEGRPVSRRAIALHDIEVALFHVALKEPLYCMPPKEIRREGWIWSLDKALYGTRVAAQLFQDAVRDMYAATFGLRSKRCRAYTTLPRPTASQCITETTS